MGLACREDVGRLGGVQWCQTNSKFGRKKLEHAKDAIDNALGTADPSESKGATSLLTNKLVRWDCEEEIVREAR